MEIESISAITLSTRNMARALQFYLTLGFNHAYGGPADNFASFHVGSGHLNLDLDPSYVPTAQGRWGRVIIYVDDVDAVYQRAISKGLKPTMAPRDADWGERYFHISDPDGHEISFARPLKRPDPPRSRSDELAERAMAIYRDSKPKLDEIVARARPRAQEMSRQALRLAREHEDELRQAADALARTRLRGSLGIAASALASPTSGTRKRRGRTCSACQTLNPQVARFCSQCGTPLVGEGPSAAKEKDD
jgi:catechol 2,3-dioxygenase-like lactoylglutathione lyase family enzyme